MTAKYVYLVDTGIASADTEDLLNDVKSEWYLASNNSLNTSSSTPQGTLIAAETLARSGVMKNNAEQANQMNPNYAYGLFLDANCAFLGIERGESDSTFITGAIVSGNSQVTIPAGSRVQLPAGDVFFVISTVIIPISGSTTVDLQSSEYGNIDVALGTLTIIDGSIGWGSIKVDSTATITAGSLQLTDPQLKNARNQRLAIQGRGNTLAIQANTLSVSNVTSVSIVENNTGTAQAINGVTFTLPNAMWVCVAGRGTEADIAAELYAAHGGGCPWDYGNVGVRVGAPNGVLVYDPYTNMPYRVKYTTPVYLDGYVIVNLKQSSSAASPTEAIQNALINYAEGNIAGEDGFIVGASMSAFELAGAITASFPRLYLQSVSVAAVAAGLAPPAPGAYTTEYVVGPHQQIRLYVGNVKVNVL